MNQIRAYVEEALNDDNDDSQLGFELDVPDHLANSPLCPLSSMHKSGGRAICPLHGRRKPAQPVRSQTRHPPKLEPRIVYEGKVEQRRRSSGETMLRTIAPAVVHEDWRGHVEKSGRSSSITHFAGVVQDKDGSWSRGSVNSESSSYF